MDFRLAGLMGVHLICAAAVWSLSGCSSSLGYVDYASIPGPGATVQPESKKDSVSANQIAGTEDQPDNATADQVDTERPATDANAQPGETVSTADNTSAAQEQAGAESNIESGAPDAATTKGRPGDAVVVSDGSSDVVTPEAVEPLEIKLLIPSKRFRAEGDASALRLTYDDIDLLKILNMQPVPTDAPRHFPTWLSELDGKRIRIRGFMYPTFEATGIDYFRLARDNGICCFVKQPKIYDIIDVVMADGETTDYIENKPFDVEGTFRIDPEADDTELFQLYRIEDAIVLK